MQRWRIAPRRPWRAILAVTGAVALSSPARAELPHPPTVAGVDLDEVQVGSTLEAALAGPPVAWSTLARTSVSPGPRWLAVTIGAGTPTVLVPTCAGREEVFVDDAHVATPSGPFVVDLPADGRAHRVALRLGISGYEHRVTCGAPPRAGTRATAQDGLVALTFASPEAGAMGGHAVAYVPPGHDLRRPGALLVGLHPWNGSIWTYAAYESLLASARARDVVLLFPSGLGNSLYTARAEDEVLRGIAALGLEVAIDPDRITLFGASMGGAGATTIGFHHPDRFAALVSFFGDSRYDLTTYVHAILRDPAAAHLVNALDVVDNARNVPVWLVHGEEDHVSPIAQSAVLARALAAKGFAVTFDRIPGGGHEGRLVTDLAPRVVELASRGRREVSPRRVSYWSVRPGDVEAYGIRLTRASRTTDAFFDLERVGDALHLRSAIGVRRLDLPTGAFGFGVDEAPAVLIDDPAARSVVVSWDAPR